jgi:hypothetical protein
VEKDYRLSGVTSSAGRTLGFFENILRNIENIFKTGGMATKKNGCLPRNWAAAAANLAVLLT